MSESQFVQPSEREQVRVLDLDPVLRSTVPSDRRESARAGLTAPSISAAPGAWSPEELSDPSALGAIVLEGLLTRNVEIAGTRSREILGPGDIIRPWDDDSAFRAVPSQTTWTILMPARFALLDRRWKVLGARWPRLGDEILHRVLRRSRWLAIVLAIANVRGIESRVLLLLWHLAGSWGRVTPSGTLVPFALTHELIAELMGARRPSVTTALARMERERKLERVQDGWLLHARPPGRDG